MIDVKNMSLSEQNEVSMDRYVLLEMGRELCLKSSWVWARACWLIQSHWTNDTS
jgi:hypothetical protein